MNQTTRVHTRTSSAWAWVPVMILGSMFVGLGTMTYLALDDPGFALEPNYYDKAVHWDRRQAEAQASRELGLRLSLTKPLVVSASGEIAIELAVLDRAGSPYQGASLKIEAFPNARASRVQQLSLREVAPGLYRGKLEDGRRGLWELRISVSRAADRYREVMRLDVNKGQSA